MASLYSMCDHRLPSEAPVGGEDGSDANPPPLKCAACAVDDSAGAPGDDDDLVRALAVEAAVDFLADDWTAAPPTFPSTHAAWDAFAAASRDCLPSYVRIEASGRVDDAIRRWESDERMRNDQAGAVATLADSVFRRFGDEAVARYEEAIARGAVVVLDEDGLQFAFRPGDTIRPVCHVGQSRSQVLFQLALRLQAAAAEAGGEAIEVEAPHGAESGCDPFTAYQDLTEDNYFGYLHAEMGRPDEPSEWAHRAFVDAFGDTRRQRVGQDPLNAIGGGMMINNASDLDALADVRSNLRAWFDSHYFSLGAEAYSDHKRMVIVCFQRALPIVLGRLLENNDLLTGVVVVSLLDGDEIPNSGNSLAVAAAKRQFPEYFASAEEALGSAADADAHIRHAISTAVHQRQFKRFAAKFVLAI